MAASFQSVGSNGTVNLSNYAVLFLEPGTMELHVKKDAFKTLSMRGSATQTEQENINSAVYSIEDELRPLVEAGAPHEQRLPFITRIRQADYTFFETHPDSYLSPYRLQFHTWHLPVDSLEGFYNGFTQRIKESVYGKVIAGAIAKQKRVAIGVPAKSFSSSDINGKQIQLSDYKSKKYVLLDFWASWCVPCRKGNPHLKLVYAKYKEKGLEIIGVSDDDNRPDLWKKAVEQDGIGIWKHVLRGLKTDKSLDQSDDILKMYGIQSLPTKILIDPNGVIIGRYGEGGQSDEAMDKKLSEIFVNEGTVVLPQ